VPEASWYFAALENSLPPKKFTRARNPTSEVFLLSLLPTHLLAPSSGPSTKLQLAKNWQSA